MRGAVLASLLVSLLAGCDSLASSTYVGQPLFTLTGTFQSTANAPADPVAGVALLWQDSATADGPGVAATTVPVAIQFPATFRIDVPAPPPDTARFAFADTGVELAEAYVYVVADTSAAQLEPRGADRVHVLVYAGADITDGSAAADYLGGPMSAGYHLRQFAPSTSPGAAQAALIARCVSSGATPAACHARRDYQLGPIADDDPLRIAVTPP
jgi:hypothetical protein